MKVTKHDKISAMTAQIDELEHIKASLIDEFVWGDLCEFVFDSKIADIDDELKPLKKRVMRYLTYKINK